MQNAAKKKKTGVSNARYGTNCITMDLGAGPLWPVKHRKETLGNAIIRRLVRKWQMLVLGRIAKNKLQGKNTLGKLVS